MQSASTSRSSKRSTATEPSSVHLPMASNSTASNSGARVSSGSSSRSSTHKKQSPGQQLSQIEKSVTHLLVATKQLLETLTQWSRHNATEGEVSDVYVRLGYEFNIACRAFNGIGVDTADLGPVPELLRTILEETLSQEASPASLDKFLPRIRDIIINLLHGLKKKQSRLRAKQAKDGTSPSATAPAVPAAGNSVKMPEPVTETSGSRRSINRGSSRWTSSGSTVTGPTEATNGDWSVTDEPTSKYSTSTRMNGDGAAVAARSSYDDQQPKIITSDSEPSIDSLADTSSTANGDSPAYAISNVGKRASQRDHNYFPAPPPPPKQQDALAALQRGGDLERRASRRYSAYQISKHLGASTNGIPMIPPAQNSPIPNRGKDVRDSMNAVRTRGSGMYSQSRSGVRTGDSSPARSDATANRTGQETGSIKDVSNSSTLVVANDATRSATSVDGTSPASEKPKLAATLTGPVETLPTYHPSPDEEQSQQLKLQSPVVEAKTPTTNGDQTVQQFVPETSPQPGKELTLFLQYKSKIKKFVLPGGTLDLSIPRLQLAFIEKFAWNTHSNGNDLPEIYIQDPVSGVRHELEDLRDVKDRCVLVLNIEPLEEVKRHIDDGLQGVKKVLEGVRHAVDSQHVSLQRVQDRQQDTSREVARLSIRPDSSLAQKAGRSSSLSKTTAPQSRAIQTLRQDLSAVRQTFTSLVTEINDSMESVQEAAASVKAIAIEGVVPNLDATQGRSYVDLGKKSLGEDSERIVTEVDDLQDIVEDLRKDVVLRGVRPLPRQLEGVNKRISGAAAELKKMQDYVRKEKPIWTKIWERELAAVCTDRDFLTLQEDLAKDLENDLEQAAETFTLVEQATKQQSMQASAGTGVTLRNTSRTLDVISSDQGIDPIKAKDGVLGEVRALRPNHESRLEAIERAERVRQMDLESRKGGEFAREVATFVEEGRLKKSVGYEEIERTRLQKDEENMKEVWQRERERAAAKKAAREAEKAERAAAAAAAAEGGSAPKSEPGTRASAETAKSESTAGDGDESKDHDKAPATPDKSGGTADSPASPSSRSSSWLPSIFSSGNSAAS